MTPIEIRIPAIGDFENVPVIEVHVSPGQELKQDDPIVTLESDKATMEVPAPQAGTVKAVHVKVGDRVSEGSLILTLAAIGADAERALPPSAPTETPAPVSAPEPSPAAVSKSDLHADVLVLGAGPGGYSAAFRAADLGKKVVLVERFPELGGVCLNVGCIPSKALLHAAKVIDDALAMSAHGLAFSRPSIDIGKLRGWKDGVVGKLVGGLAALAKQRKVVVLQGLGTFVSPHALKVVDGGGSEIPVSFDTAIIAAGSEPVPLAGMPLGDTRIIDSTGALEITDVPKRLLIIGAGIIGLEMATVYYALGSAVTVVELMDQIIPEADRDIVVPLLKRIEKRYENIYLKTKVVKVEASSAGLVVHFEGGRAPATDTFDKILVAVGRQPSGHSIGADAAGVFVNEEGFIPVDGQMRTNVAHIFAVGDIVGQPMLAHKASHEAKVAAEVATGLKSAFDARVIPSVAYTDPEVAWVGLTERQARAKGVSIGKGIFPWAASGRSLTLGRDDGVTKVLFDEETHRIVGCGVVGTNAGELMAEAALAIEMGADAIDIGHTIHPHPTLSETFGMAAEAFEGTITDLYAPKKTNSV
jgi:dihydrolipoamide dehydrogenase